MSKSEIIEFLEDRNTYLKVLEYIKLRVKGDFISTLTPNYFIAGGSVANTLHFIYNKKQSGYPKINDVDLFNIEYKDDLINGGFLDTWLDGDMSSDTDDYSFLNGGSTSDYHGTYHGQNGEVVRMLKSTREGLLNFISIEVKYIDINNFDPQNYYKFLLDNFDINSCGAGLDLVNEKILYTDDFVDFLLTNKLEITKISNPLKSFIRLYSKIKDLECDCDFDTEYDMVRHSFLFHKKDTFVIGDEWSIKLMKYRDLMDRYFILNETVKTIDKKTLQYYVPKDFIINPLFYYSIFSGGTLLRPGSFMVLWDIFVKNKYGEPLKRVVESIMNTYPVKYSELIDRKFSNNIDNIFCNLRIDKNYFNTTFTERDISSLLLFKSVGIPIHYFRCDTFDEHVKVLEYVYGNFLSKHTNQFDINLFHTTYNRMTTTEQSQFGKSSSELCIQVLSKSLNLMWIKNRQSFNKHTFKGPYF